MSKIGLPRFQYYDIKTEMLYRLVSQLTSKY